MRSVCLHFSVHQPFRFRNYRFFDINDHHNYYDDYQNKYLTGRLAERCYLPMNRLIRELIKQHGEKLKISFSISGSSIELFKLYAPAVLEDFQNLAATGNIEITGTTFNNSLSSVRDKDLFIKQVKDEQKILKETFGVIPKSFYNTELIYSDEIGEWLSELGFKSVLTEGAKPILGWKSAHFVYCNPYCTDLQILLRNYSLTDDLCFRFNDRSWENYPLTADKFANWIDNGLEDNQVCNLFMDYETFGEYNTVETGIFEFFKALIHDLIARKIIFQTPHEITTSMQPVSTLHVPFLISGAGEEKDISSWLGNELQEEAFNKLSDLFPLVEECNDSQVLTDYQNLQAADHFNFMATHWFPHQAVRRNFEVYPSPYQAFINYMNILSDLKLRVKG